MQTADWALVISICSAAVALAGFVWNVWSKFIYPKPRVRVSTGLMTVLDRGAARDQPRPKVISLSATKMGPVQVTLYNALVRTRRKGIHRSGYGLLNPLHNYPLRDDFSIGPFGGGLPKKLEIGEQFSVHLTADHEGLAAQDWDRVGFYDTFGQHHWAPKKVSDKTRKEIQEFRQRLHPQLRT
jgi:hypothetical protein